MAVSMSATIVMFALCERWYFRKAKPLIVTEQPAARRPPPPRRRRRRRLSLGHGGSMGLPAVNG